MPRVQNLFVHRATSVHLQILLSFPAQPCRMLCFVCVCVCSVFVKEGCYHKVSVKFSGMFIPCTVSLTHTHTQEWIYYFGSWWMTINRGIRYNPRTKIMVSYYDTWYNLMNLNNYDFIYLGDLSCTFLPYSIGLKFLKAEWVNASGQESRSGSLTMLPVSILWYYSY